METLLNWILTESNGPKNIRQLALEVLLEIDRKKKKIGPIVVSDQVYDLVSEQFNKCGKLHAIRSLRQATSESITTCHKAIVDHFGAQQ